MPARWCLLPFSTPFSKSNSVPLPVSKIERERSGSDRWNEPARPNGVSWGAEGLLEISGKRKKDLRRFKIYQRENRILRKFEPPGQIILPCLQSQRTPAIGFAEISLFAWVNLANPSESHPFFTGNRSALIGKGFTLWRSSKHFSDTLVWVKNLFCNEIYFSNDWLETVTRVSYDVISNKVKIMDGRILFFLEGGSFIRSIKYKSKYMYYYHHCHVIIQHNITVEIFYFTLFLTSVRAAAF